MATPELNETKSVFFFRLTRKLKKKKKELLFLPVIRMPALIVIYIKSHFVREGKSQDVFSHSIKHFWFLDFNNGHRYHRYGYWMFELLWMNKLQMISDALFIAKFKHSAIRATLFINILSIQLILHKWCTPSWHCMWYGIVINQYLYWFYWVSNTTLSNKCV